MTRDEALAVLRVMAEADGGCESCVAGQFAGLAVAFPEHLALVRACWEDQAFAGRPYPYGGWGRIEDQILAMGSRR